MSNKIKSIFLSILLLGIGVLPARAVEPTVTITQLPQYTNKQEITISYSALTDDPDNISAQFYVMKEGEGYSAFGPVFTGPSGMVKTSSGQLNDQKKFFFKVVINSGEAFAETSIIYDSIGPSAVYNYSKEQTAPGNYKLLWKNPVEKDFAKVYIYRSENPEFTADKFSQVAEVSGSFDQEMKWENNGLDTSKTYYFAIRAIDKAGNPSSVVADPQTEGTVLGTSVTPASTVSILPVQRGQILSDEDEVIEEVVDLSVDEESWLNTIFDDTGEPFWGVSKRRWLIYLAAFAIGLAMSVFFTRKVKGKKGR